MLTVRDQLDMVTSRTRRTATLSNDAGTPLLDLSPLLDAVLLDAGFGEITLSGVERLTDERTGLTEREFAQVWHVKLLSDLPDRGIAVAPDAATQS